MKSINRLFLIVVFLFALQNLASAQTPGFSYITTLTQGGSLTTPTYEKIVDSTIDASGNIFWTGSFIGSSDFDIGPGVNMLSSSPGSYDAFISALNLNQGYLGTIHLGVVNSVLGSGVGIARIIAANNGNLIYAGNFIGGVDFNPFSSNYFLGGSTPDVRSSVLNPPLNPVRDMYFTIISAAGINTLTIGGNDDDFINDMIVDNTGNIYITGGISNTVDMDPGTGVHNVIASNNYQNKAFVAKYDPSGGFLWEKLIPIVGIGDNAGKSIQFDSQQNIIAFGTYGVYGANVSAYIAKLDPASGNIIWQKNLTLLPNQIVLDANNNIYAGGSFYGTVDFDPDPVNQYNLTSLSIPWNGLPGNILYTEDAYVQKLDPQGNFLWVVTTGSNSVTAGNSSSDSVYSLTVNACGNVVAAGTFHDTIDLDPNPNNTLNVSIQALGTTWTYNSDNFIWVLDPNGNYVNHARYGEYYYDDIGPGRVKPILGNLLGFYGGFSTYFMGAFDFNPGPGVANISASGSSDGFLNVLVDNSCP